MLGVVKDASRPHPLSPSLDRIDPTRGYVRDNVRLVAWGANSARNNLSDAQFAVMIEATHRIIQSAALQ